MAPRKPTWLAEAILAEDGGRYLIQWAGVDESGEAWKPTWEPRVNANAALVSAWRERNGLKPKLEAKAEEIETKLHLARAVQREAGPELPPDSPTGSHLSELEQEGEEDVKPHLAELNDNLAPGPLQPVPAATIYSLPSEMLAQIMLDCDDASLSCTGLSKLTINIDGQVTLELETLMLPSLAGLTNLIIYQPDLITDFDSHFDHPLHRPFSNYPSPHFHLRSLTLQVYGSELSPRLVHSILSKSAHTLVTLKLENLYDDVQDRFEPVYDEFHLVASNLRHLVLPADESYFYGRLSECTSLISLTLPALSDGINFHQALRNLPNNQTLKRLSIYGFDNSDTSLFTLLSALRIQPMKNLAHLALTNIPDDALATWEEHHPDLFKKCNRKKCPIKVEQYIFGFPS